MSTVTSRSVVTTENTRWVVVAADEHREHSPNYTAVLSRVFTQSMSTHVIMIIYRSASHAQPNAIVERRNKLNTLDESSVRPARGGRHQRADNKSV